MINVAELDERIDRCLAILADNPHSQVFAALAETYRRRGEFGRAFSVCKSGLKHHPDYGPAHVVLAKLYLHQKMLPDALSSLRRAAELDGPTRVTDLLEAEVQLALGDYDAAQMVIDRLRVTDSSNLALPELIGQLKRLRSAPPPSPAPDPGEEPSQRPQSPGAASRSVPECTDWQAWVETLGALQGVDMAFVSDDHGRVVAGYPETSAARTAMDRVLDMLQELTAQLSGALWGSLSEVRIQASRGDVWAKKWGDVVIGFVGSQSPLFGATRQRGLDLAGRVQIEPPSLQPAATDT